MTSIHVTSLLTGHAAVNPLVRRQIRRKNHRERGSAPQSVAGRGHRPAVHGHDVFADAETDAESGLQRGWLTEPLEQLGDRFRRQAYASVADDDLDLIAVDRAHGNRDGAP